jgi:hypothetical protein
MTFDWLIVMPESLQILTSQFRPNRPRSQRPLPFVNDSQCWMIAFSIFSDRSRAMTPAAGGVKPKSSKIGTIS